MVNIQPLSFIGHSDQSCCLFRASDEPIGKYLKDLTPKTALHHPLHDRLSARAVWSSIAGMSPFRTLDLSICMAALECSGISGLTKMRFMWIVQTSGGLCYVMCMWPALLSNAWTSSCERLLQAALASNILAILCWLVYALAI